MRDIINFQGVYMSINKYRKAVYLNKKFILSLKVLGLEELYYKIWKKAYERYNQQEVMQSIKKFKYAPLISILIPVYNVSEKYLSECLESINKQTYTNWEICLVDDCSSKEETKQCIEKYKRILKDKLKVRYREENGHISVATNDALNIATGEFILLLDNDDILSRECLYEIAKEINKYPKVDLIYSNEDKLKNNVRFYPYFKPKWNRKILKIDNYISHVGVYRRSIAVEIGGFAKGLEGAQDWDFVLRYTQRTNSVRHIPKFLYHWRVIESSTAMDINNKPYAIKARERVQALIWEGKYD